MSSEFPPSEGRRHGPAEARRDFLRKAAAAAAAMALSRTARALARDPSPDGELIATPAPILPTLDRSRVTRVTEPKMVPVRVVQRALLRDCLKDGLCSYAETTSVADAWHKILKPDDVVLLKFNQSGAIQLGTRPAMVMEIVDSLLGADWPPEQLILLEQGDRLIKRYQTKPVDYRWQDKAVKFGKSGEDSFIASLDQATAIINVPFLKTHHLATMTSCLKNLSHGLIRHPARFHANGCDPAIGEIASSEPIRSKLKLNIVNGLRVVFDKGPEASADQTVSAGVILIGADPVACDAIGYGILNEIRARHDLLPLLPGARVPRQLLTAARLGLGHCDVEEIDLHSLPA